MSEKRRTDMPEMTPELLKLLAELNRSAKLVILDTHENSLAPFYVVDKVGYHEPTQQIVFLMGVRIDEQGTDADHREQVKWEDC